LITWKPQGTSTEWSTEMTAPTAPAAIGDGAPEAEQVEAAVEAVRTKWAKRQAAETARQAAQAEEDKLRQARRASKKAARRARLDGRADRAMDAADGAGFWARRAAPVVGAAVPVAMVNGTAFIGQFAYIKDHVPWVLPGQVLVAATFESVAVYLAWHAHLAMMKNDSSTRLKLGAQLFALVMGAMNYSHYSVHWHPTVMAVGLGLMSLLSPSLWGIYSRRAARDKLMERGLVEEHAVRLGANRWTWHPLRSVVVMWRATWVGENNPQRAIGLWEAHRAERRARVEARRAARAIERARDKGAPQQAARQEQAAPEAAAPAARQPVPASPAPQLPAAPEKPAPQWVQDEQDARRVIDSFLTLPPAGPLAVIPGTRLNGAEVKAIANLSAKPTMKASHEIDPQRLAEVELHLAGLPADGLPAERAVSDMLCPGSGHNHRRAAPAPRRRPRRDRDSPLQPSRRQAGQWLTSFPRSFRRRGRPGPGSLSRGEPGSASVPS
jgi:hypothetical protein